MKNVLIAVDSFKGSLSSLEAGNAIMNGLYRNYPEFDFEVIQVADGGEGTLDALSSCMNIVVTELVASDPLLRKIKSEYGIFENENSAIIETAKICGITLLKEQERNPLIVTSFGVGELIKDAIKKDSKNIYIGLGGSATNDAGMGMASALGARFYDKNGKEINPVPKNFPSIHEIDTTELRKNINSTSLKILADVKNILYGDFGATHIFSSQKGADEEMKIILEENIKYIADLTEKTLNVKCADLPGSGAAGGLGFGLLSFTNAEIINGADFVIKKNNIEEKIRKADVIITGEGKLDSQTEFDKLPAKIAELSKRNNKKCICISGISELPGSTNRIFDEIYSVVNSHINIDHSLKYPKECLMDLASKIKL